MIVDQRASRWLFSILLMSPWEMPDSSASSACVSPRSTRRPRSGSPGQGGSASSRRRVRPAGTTSRCWARCWSRQSAAVTSSGTRRGSPAAQGSLGHESRRASCLQEIEGEGVVQPGAVRHLDGRVDRHGRQHVQDANTGRLLHRFVEHRGASRRDGRPALGAGRLRQPHDHRRSCNQAGRRVGARSASARPRPATDATSR